jgi:hypothetical protein
MPLPFEVVRTFIIPDRNGRAVRLYLLDNGFVFVELYKAAPGRDYLGLRRISREVLDELMVTGVSPY